MSALDLDGPFEGNTEQEAKTGKELGDRQASITTELHRH